MRVIWLMLGLFLLAGSILSTALARTMGYTALLVVVPAFLGAGWAILKASFPPAMPEMEQAPPGVEGKVASWATSRIALLTALSIVAAFAPVWVWIVPLFGLQSIYRAHRMPGGISANLKRELKHSVKYLGLTAVNLIFFAITLVLATLTSVVSFILLYTVV